MSTQRLSAEWYTIRHIQSGRHISTQWTNPKAVEYTTRNVDDMMSFAKLSYAQSFFTANNLDIGKFKIAKWTMEDV